ncbi:site-specific DNA-methyltransferase [Helicobacter canis]|uniref:site-specific DNA-methyltransferase n=1 Tax=Helicobacter canis TaxID=29419 RepID=UPI002943DBE7|nr:site-specific DNA-methyltransferase [Helicobacter canis]
MKSLRSPPPYQHKPTNSIYLGDNLHIILALILGSETTKSLRGKVDLIYIDPPFDSKADYKSKIALSIDSSITKAPTILEQFAYSDTWHKGTISYLQMLTPRLMLMRELLSDKGSIYIHCDWHCGHYIKVLCDEIFGRENFRNEIICRRINKNMQKQFNKLNSLNVYGDSVLIYAKSPSTAFNPPMKKFYREGYWHSFKQPADRPTMRYELCGVNITKGQWMWAKDRALKAVENYEVFVKHYADKMSLDEYCLKNPTLDFIRLTKSGKNCEYYLPPKNETICDTLWEDILGYDYDSDYPTAKNIKFMERIIQMASNKGDLVADFFMGGGATLVAANRMNRKFVGADIGKPAVMITRRRLLDDNAEFAIFSIGEYEKASKNIGELAQIVLSLYVSEGGELPKTLENTPKNIGYLESSRVLVYVDSPNAITSEATFKKCESLRQGFLGQEWGEVILLGWNYSLMINDVLKRYKKIKPQVIPPDLLEKLRKNKGYESLVGKVRFSSLQYLSIKPLRVRENPSDRTKALLTIELENYVLLSPNALPLDKAEDREKVIEIMNTKPLSLIEYWSVDTNYNGAVFVSQWQDFRGGREDDNGQKSLSVLEKIELEVPKLARYNVCVKSVDIFGYEAMAQESVAVEWGESSGVDSSKGGGNA